MNYKLPKWIKVGMLITLTSIIAGVLVFTPVLSQAIDVFTNVDQGPVVSAAIEADPNAPPTDHPEGRLVNAIVADALLQTSNEDPQVAIQSGEPDHETPVMTNEQEGTSLPEEGGGMLAADMQAEAANINATTPVLVIPGADFRSDGVDPDGFFFSFFGGYLVGEDDVASNTCLMAPVYLPDGVTISDYYATIVDNSTTLKIWLGLYRLDNYTGEVVQIGYAETTADYASPNLVTIYDYTISDPLVTYPSFSYYVGTCIEDSDIHLYSVRIYYE
jgi:hypothetical protein